MRNAFIGLPEGNKQKASADFIAWSHRTFEKAGSPGYPSYRRYTEAIFMYDVVVSFGFLTQADQHWFRRRRTRSCSMSLSGAARTRSRCARTAHLTGANAIDLPMRVDGDVEAGYEVP